MFKRAANVDPAKSVWGIAGRIKRYFFAGVAVGIAIGIDIGRQL